MGKKESIRDFIVMFLIYTVLMLLVVFKLNNYYLTNLDNILLNILLTVGLSLTIGFLGQLTLCNAGFMAIGAYTGAIITTYLKLPPLLLFPIAILVSGIVSGFFGILIGIPALRLKGDYLAIITLAFGEIIKNVVQNLKITGGAKGFKGIRSYSENIATNEYINFTVIFFLTAFAVIFVKNIMSSRHGRAIISIKEDEIAAEASGINVTYYKILTFSMTAFFAGIAGVLYSHHTGILDPAKFNFNYSVEMVIMVVLGGMGNIVGSIIAAIFLTVLPQILVSYSEYRMLIYSVLLIATMLIKTYKPDLFSKMLSKIPKIKGGK